MFLNLCSFVQVTVYRTAVLPVAVQCTSCYSLLSFHVGHSRNIALTGHCSFCKDTVQVFIYNSYVYLLNYSKLDQMWDLTLGDPNLNPGLWIHGLHNRVDK